MICSSHNDQDWKGDPGVYKHGEWVKVTPVKRARVIAVLVLMVVGYPVCLRGLRAAFQRVVQNNNVVEEFEQWTNSIRSLARIATANEIRYEVRWASATTVRTYLNIR